MWDKDLEDKSFEEKLWDDANISLTPLHLEGVYPRRSEGLFLDNLLPAWIIPWSCGVSLVDLVSKGLFWQLRTEGKAQQW